MSRKRAKSLKLDQVINLILDDTVSSSSSGSEWDSDDQAEKYQNRKDTKSEKKNQSVTCSDDDDDDVPLWKLASKSVNNQVEEDESSNNSDDLPLWKLLDKSKNISMVEKDESSNNSDDMPLAVLVEKKKPFGTLSLNISANQNNKVDSPEKYSKKLTKCLLKGIYDFLENQTFLVKCSINNTDEALSSDEETNDEKLDNLNLDDNFDKENNSGIEKKVLKRVEASPAIKMECRKDNKYYMSLKNLKRKKIF